MVFIDKGVLAGVTVESSHSGFLQGQLTTRKCLRTRHDPTGLSEIHNALFFFFYTMACLLLLLLLEETLLVQGLSW